MWVVLGNLDCVHLGHQQLLTRAKSQNSTVQVISFDPHPISLLRPPFSTILSSLENDHWLSQYGASRIHRYPFDTRFSRLTAQEFISQIRLDFPQMVGIVVGFNFRFGHQREGDVNFLQRLSSDHNLFQLQVVEPVQVEGEGPVSTTRVRESLQRGDLIQVKKYLNRNFGFFREVVSGDSRGKEILNVPTANMEINSDHPLKDGVYSSRLRWNGNWLPSVSFKGAPPTFQSEKVRLETHVLSQDQFNLRGHRLEVELLSYQRENRVFDSLENLKAQITKDCERSLNDFQKSKGS